MSGDSCSRCGEELSAYSACSCAFAPHYPRAASSSATSAPASMRALLAQRGREARDVPLLTVAQHGTLVRLTRGAAHVHGATARRLLAFRFIREKERAEGATTAMRALYEATPEGHAAVRAMACEAERRDDTRGATMPDRLGVHQRKSRAFEGLKQP